MGYYEKSRRGFRREESRSEEPKREQSRKKENRDEVFEKFNYFTLPNNVSGAVNIVISANPSDPTILASLNVHADHDDAVWLTATIGWKAVYAFPDGVVKVLFKIWRDAPLTGRLVSSALVGGESDYERNYVTSFSHVDDDLSYFREHHYFLTAEVVIFPRSISVPGAGAPSTPAQTPELPPLLKDIVVVTGPLTFTASTIELE